MKTALRVLCALCVATSVTGAAGQVFRTRADAVRVDVLVTNGNRPVGGLRAENFELFDNGVQQTIESVAIEDVPFSMLLVLDTSASMRGQPLADLKAAAAAAVNLLGESDRAAVLSFSDPLRRSTGWLRKGPELTSAIEDVQASGSTALFDAAFTGMLLRDPEAGRRSVMLLFSDGKDTRSWLPAAAAWDKAARTEVVVYTVRLGSEDSPGPDISARVRSLRTTENGSSTLRRDRLFTRSGVRLSPGAVLIEQSPFLTEIAERTGGDALVAETAAGLREAFERIVADFRSRYLLSYVPAGVDMAGWHRLEVKLKNRAGKVTARRGYDRGDRSR